MIDGDDAPHIVDLWPPFCDFWQSHGHLAAAQQVPAWLCLLARLEPEVHARYAAAMSEDGQAWAEDLLEHHWSALPARLPEMAAVHDRLLAVFAPAAERVREALGTDLQPVLVIMPLGYGGWATTYRGRPACDLGLDTVVELQWTDPEALRGLIAHELGHLAHYTWRQQLIEYHARGPLWDIYDEGFAQVCEGLVAGREQYHLERAQPGWLQWCREHRARLAREFLRRVDEGEPLRGFFGSYPECNIEGYRETGYFLGQEVVGEWVAEEGLHRVAVLPEGEAVRRVRETLEQFAAEGKWTT